MRIAASHRKLPILRREREFGASTVIPIAPGSQIRDANKMLPASGPEPRFFDDLELLAANGRCLITGFDIAHRYEIERQTAFQRKLRGQ